MNNLKKNNVFGIALFFLIIICFSTFVYYSATRVDYVWHWEKVPQYFVYTNTIEVKAEVEGVASKITDENNKTFVTIANETEQEKYELNKDDIRINEGDYVYMGDTLSTYKKKQVGIILEGLWITLKVSIISIFFGILMGLIGGLARISDNITIRWLAITYVELVRGSPLLVQIFIWYFVIGTLVNSFLNSINVSLLPPMFFGAAALSSFTGAYVTEMVRAGIQSINKGQTEAARSLGMTKAATMRYVVLPQAIIRILPPLAGQFISLIKDSSLLGIIAIRELTKATREVVATSLQPFELWFLCAILYLLLTMGLSVLVQYLERRFLVK